MKKEPCIRAICFVTFLFFSFVAVAAAITVTLQWDRNSEEDLSKYTIYWRAPGGEYVRNETAPFRHKDIIVTDASSTNDTQHPREVSLIIEGDEWEFVATAGDESGRESGYSNQVDTIKPLPPSGLTLSRGIKIDNGDNSLSSSIGTWKQSGAAGSYNNISEYSRVAGSTYTFETALSGSFDVFLRWTAWDSRCNAVPIKIYDGDTLIGSLNVNQQENTNEWFPLGTYPFTGTARVVVTAIVDNCSTCVDGSRFISK